MTNPVVATDARDLQRRVAGLVAAAKGSDPMAAVTLVVDSPLAGTVMRRQLVASGALGAGVTGLHLTTIDELLTDLAAATGVAAPSAVTASVREAVVAGRLAEHPGPFAASAEHPSTALRLSDELAELRWVSLDGAETAAAGATSTTKAVLDFIAGARDDLSSLVGARPDVDVAGDVAAALADALAPGEASRLGTVVVVAQRVPSPVRDVLDALTPHVAGVTVVALEPQVGLAVEHESCPDPTTEAALAARRVVALLDEGARPDQVAILYGSDSPYAALVGAALDSCGIAWHGPTASTLGATSYARVVDVVLAMAEGRADGASGITRPLLLRWFSIGPLVHGDGFAPTSPWGRLIREENLYGDAAGWRATLERLSLVPEVDVEDDDIEALERRRRRAERTAEAAVGLGAFLSGLDASLTEMTAATTWAGLGDAVLALLDATTPSSGRWQQSDDERQARQRVAALLGDELAGLDTVRALSPSAPAPSAAVLRQMVARDLLSRRGRHGDIGVGIHVGPVRGAETLAFEHVLVVGAAEGLLPPLASEDPLLPDPVREGLRRSPDDLSTSVERPDALGRAWRSVLGGARDRWVTWPRGAVPGRGLAHPSRFLDDPRPRRKVASQWVLLLEEPWPASTVDLALRSLLCAGVDDVPDDLAVTVAAARAAKHAGFDRYHGALEDVVDDLVWDITASPLSASAIEGFLHCPYHFFVQRVLGVSTDTVSDEVDEVAPKDLGTLLHEALDAFVQRAAAEGWVPGPGEAWPSDAVAVLTGLLRDRAADAEERGLTGWRPAWEARLGLVVDALPDLLHQDALKVRADPPLAPERSEVRFGGVGEQQVSIALADGSAVSLRGAIDRVDVGADGTAVGVVDYKSGRSEWFSKSLGRPKRGGGAYEREKVQDLVYDVAARVLHPEATDVGVRFVFVPDEGAVTVVTADASIDREAALRGILERMAAAGRDGRFAPRPASDRDWCPVCKQLGRRARSVARDAGADLVEAEGAS